VVCKEKVFRNMQLWRNLGLETGSKDRVQVAKKDSIFRLYFKSHFWRAKLHPLNSRVYRG
jgi:hypothetical protein